ncbi:MAG: ABC transporter substrate-binding protein [Dehalococcoidia bacterium]
MISNYTGSHARWTQPSRRRFLSIGMTAGLAAAVAACSDGTTTSKTPASPAAATSVREPKRGGTLRWGLEATIETLDPTFTAAAVTTQLAMNLYDQLFTWDADQQVKPVLVASHEASSDRRLYRFTLRDDATFEGGRPVLASDVVASIQRWGKTVSSGRQAAALFNSLEARGERSFAIELMEPWSVLIDTLAAGPKAPYIMTEEAASTPIGTPVNDVVASGPFRLQEWVKGSEIILQRREDYAGPPGPSSNAAGSRTVYLNTVDIPIIPDPNSRLAAFQAGTLDALAQPPPDYFDQLNGSSDVEVYEQTIGFYNAIYLNHTRPPFDSQLARQAVLAAVDVDQFMTAGWGTNAWEKCPAIFGCTGPLTSQVGADRFDQKNLTTARQLFQQFQQSTNYDGRPVTLVGNTSYRYMYNMSLVAKSMLEAIGFKVDLQTPDWATALAVRNNPEKWDLFHTGGHGPGSSDPLRSTILSPSYVGKYTSAALDDLKQQFAKAPSLEQARPVVDEIQALWYDDVPAIFLGVSHNYDALKTYVKGYDNASLASLFWNVWLDR